MFSNPLHLYALTFDFVHSRILPILQWPELAGNLQFWIEAHQKNKNYIEILPILSCVAAGGQVQTAVPLSAFWMLSMLAARILDDIQDGEGEGNPWHHNDNVLPMSTALLSAANVCLAQLMGIDKHILPELLDSLGRVAALAAKAQANPALYNASIEQYFERIIASSGMVFAAISWAGARLGTDDTTQLDLLQQFGYNIGMREAIRADCRDLDSRKHKKGDLSAGIYTLPVIYAISLTDHPCHPMLLARLEDRPFSGEDVAEIVDLIIDMGALDWSMSVAQTYHEKAVAGLELLPADCAEGLRIYVS